MGWRARQASARAMPSLRAAGSFRLSADKARPSTACASSGNAAARWADRRCTSWCLSAT